MSGAGGADRTTYSREAIAHALALWSEGEQQATRPTLPPAWRAAYAAAVPLVLATLQACQTLQDLCAWYYNEPAHIEAALVQATQPASGHSLNWDMVEDAAYWRRAQELLAAAGQSAEAYEQEVERQEDDAGAPRGSERR